MAAAHFTDDNFDAEVVKSDVPVLVDFFATWCGPCKMLTPVIEELADEYEGKAKIGKLDVDEAGQTASKFKVLSVPTIGFFKGGELVDQVVGFQPKEALKEKLDGLL